MSALHDSEVLTEGLLTIAESCRFLRLSRAKLYTLLGSEIPFVRFSEDGRRGAVRVPKLSLIRYAARHLYSGASGNMRGGGT